MEIINYWKYEAVVNGKKKIGAICSDERFFSMKSFLEHAMKETPDLQYYKILNYEAITKEEYEKS